jgi:Fic family protein
MVGGVETTAPERVAGEMEELLADFGQLAAPALEEIVDFHARFEIIHPFQDGNGRIGRMVMFWQCLKCRVMPFIILDAEKAFYYRGLKEYGGQRGYLLDTCRHSQDVYGERVEKFGVREMVG